MAADMVEARELHLMREWDVAWRDVVRPWLAAPAQLRRDYVIVPSRGQAHALKLRCVREGVPLLGVEFLTAGLARRKLESIAASVHRALGRELLLLNLRALIAERLAPLTSADAAWGFWKSLQSDPERALDDFDQLLHAGFTADDFPLAPLRDVFSALTERVRALGYELAPLQHREAGRLGAGTDAPVGERVLIYGFGAEHWPEFFPLAALARRSRDVTVVLPEPEFRGRAGSDEAWAEAWSHLLGVEAELGLPDDPPAAGVAIAELWQRPPAEAPAGLRVLVGATRAAEMELVAREIARLRAAGAENIAVVFPRADAAHLRLARLLAERGVPFNDLLDTAAPAPVDTQLQRALLRFHARGARIEELLELWPLLHTLSFTTLAPAAARDVCERLFDERQTHALAALQERLAAGTRAEWKEVARIVALLLPPWPAELTLAEALERFARLCAHFHAELPETWPALADYAARDPAWLAAPIVFAALESFLPEQAPATGVAGRGQFAPVTLTTWRRAAALAWSHVIFVESNAGVWPRRIESSCWLTDEHRAALNARKIFPVGLATGDERAAAERNGCAAVARNARAGVVFSAALFDEEEPELKLAPNAWLERVLLALQPGGDVEAEFARRAVAHEPGLPDTARQAQAAWLGVWQRRRDPAAPFDGHFLCGDPAVTRPTRLAARLIERGVRDPAELWFEAVLGVRRTAWEPLVRARKKSLGQIAHRLLAAAWQGPVVADRFMETPSAEVAAAQLERALEELRGVWPRDRYWDSFHAELGEVCRALLAKVAALPSRPYVLTEWALPAGTALPLADGEPLGLAGRMDLVLLDRPEWGGATVDIVDFKTGTDARLSAAAMARGASLQLGVYLAAVATLGATRGCVWMVKPDTGDAGRVGMEELPVALGALAQLARHLATGRYGARTPDRTEFSRGYAWPIACTPVRAAVLEAKFAATFGLPVAEAEEGGGDD
jgi:hypothetical protein